MPRRSAPRRRKAEPAAHDPPLRDGLIPAHGTSHTRALAQAPIPRTPSKEHTLALDIDPLETVEELREDSRGSTRRTRGCNGFVAVDACAILATFLGDLQRQGRQRRPGDAGGSGARRSTSGTSTRRATSARTGDAAAGRRGAQLAGAAAPTRRTSPPTTRRSPATRRWPRARTSRRRSRRRWPRTRRSAYDKLQLQGRPVRPGRGCRSRSRSRCSRSPRCTPHLVAVLAGDDPQRVRRC